MTKRTIIYQKITDAPTSCAPPLPSVFSNHPNLLKRVFDASFMPVLQIVTLNKNHCLLNTSYWCSLTYRDF